MVVEETRSESAAIHVVAKVVKPWVSLGSEEEITNENVVHAREKVFQELIL